MSIRKIATHARVPLCALLFVGLSINIVNASPFYRAYTFTATGFPVGAPVDVVSGEFGFTLDDLGANIRDQAPSFVDLSINGFAYGVSNTSFDKNGINIIFGGTLNSNTGIVVGTDDFYLGFSIDSDGDVVGSPPGFSFLGLVYTTSGTSAFFEASTFKVSAVPLPAALPLFAGGLTIIGLLGWRRKRMAGA